MFLNLSKILFRGNQNTFLKTKYHQVIAKGCNR